MADMTEKEVDLHKGLLQEKKAKKFKKFKSSTLPFNQSAMQTDLVPDQLDWRDYGTQTNILDYFSISPFTSQPIFFYRLTFSPAGNSHIKRTGILGVKKSGFGTS